MRYNKILSALHHVILITGTSSAGKTSLVDALKKDMGIACQTVKIDDFDFNALNIKNVSVYSGLNTELYSDPLQKEMHGLHMHAFFEHSKKNALKHQTVLVDTIFDYAEHYDRYGKIMQDPAIKTTQVLLYAPLEVIAQRVTTRKDQRTLFRAFMQFPALYKVQESPREPVVDTIKSKHVKKLLKQATQDYLVLVKPGVSLRQFTSIEKELDKFYQAFVAHFKLDSKAEIVLVPTRAYDLIINSSAASPDALAHQIASFSQKP